MKKLLTLFSSICILSMVSAAYADIFDNLQNLSPEQKSQLTRIYQKYKFENNNYETKIMEYTDKLSKVKEDTEKTPEQLSVLTGAYERNLATLKAQQKKLEEETESLYQTVMTQEQYKQYKEQQVNVQDAFNKFLQK